MCLSNREMLGSTIVPAVAVSVPTRPLRTNEMHGGDMCVRDRRLCIVDVSISEPYKLKTTRLIVGGGVSRCF